MQSGRTDSIGFPDRYRVRVVIAGPYPIVLVGVKKMMEDDARLEVVGEASTMPLLLEQVFALAPEVALVEWSLAANDLRTTTVLLESGVRGTALVFLTASDDPRERRAMMRLGVRGVVNKRANAAELQNAIWKASGRALAPKRLSGEERGGVRSASPSWPDPDFRIRQLTRREHQLIPLVCGGMRNKAIAQYLGISESTVWHHLTAVFTKLEVDDRMGLAAFAYQSGLVAPTPPMRAAGSHSAGLREPMNG